MTNFLAELRRRNVFRVAAAYLVVGWLIMQVVGTIGGAAGLPDWADSLALILLITAFPIIIFIAWAFELTPEGLKKTDAADPDAPVNPLGSGDIVLIAMLVVVAGIAVTQIATRAPTAAPSLANAEPGAPVAPIIADASIAVLPFADLSQAGDQQYFSDGISEEILNVLVRVQGLDVASRTSAFQFRGDAMGIPEIAGHLGVRHVLEGSVRKDGETIRITAQLIDARDDRHLWSQTYDRPFTAGALFAVQDEIANAIVTALRDVLDMGEAPAISVEAVTDNVDAYSLYLEARTLFQARARLDYVDQLLERAVQIDPDFSEAWEMRAAVVSLAVEYGFADTPEDEVAGRTEAFAQRALELNPDSSLALAVLAKLAMDRSNDLSTRADWTAILAQFSRAIELDPRNASALNWYGLALGSVGLLDASLASFETCIRSEASYRPCRENQVDALAALGRDAEALAALRAGLEAGALSPEYVGLALLARNGERDQFMWAANAPYHLLGWGGHVELFEALARPDRTDEALADRIRQFVASNPGRLSTSIMSVLAPLSGDGEDLRMGGTPLMYYDIHYPRYRASAWFRTWVRETGILAYWQAEGFPELCRPVGADDFECD
jgi:TolB-like protein/Tfp pilus assembly protein PilF